MSQDYYLIACLVIMVLNSIVYYLATVAKKRQIGLMLFGGTLSIFSVIAIAIFTVQIPLIATYLQSTGLCEAKLDTFIWIFVVYAIISIVGSIISMSLAAKCPDQKLANEYVYAKDYSHNLKLAKRWLLIVMIFNFFALMATAYFYL
jgi:hypothetical protein